MILRADSSFIINHTEPSVVVPSTVKSMKRGPKRKILKSYDMVLVPAVRMVITIHGNGIVWDHYVPQSCPAK